MGKYFIYLLFVLTGIASGVTELSAFKGSVVVDFRSPEVLELSDDDASVCKLKFKAVFFESDCEICQSVPFCVELYNISGRRLFEQAECSR